MPTIYIDDQPYEVGEGDNLLQAALSLGLDLPYFCWHPAMGSIGACRQCAVLQFQDADDTRGRIVMGCMTPVAEGARFSLSADRAQAFREDIIESLMLNHPHDCPVCAEGGECHLQDMTVMVGHRDRLYKGRKNTHRNQYLGPLIHHEMNRCITCYRCTRYYRDYAGGTDLASMASHDHVYFGRHEEGILESEFAGNLVEVCPTGVFTDKSLVQEYTRKWDLQSAPSVCTACSVGCNIMPGERYGKLKRIHNRFNNEVNGYFLCDRGRFGGQFVNSEERIPAAGNKDEQGRFNQMDSEDAVTAIAAQLDSGKTIGIGSPRSSLEANFLLRELVGPENFCAGMSVAEGALVQRVRKQLEHSSALIPSIRAMESADAVLVLGEDVTNTAPRIALALRQSVRNKAFELAADLRLETWQDAAIRNLAQDQRSPLSIISVAATRLDDVASHTAQLCPDDIAALGFAVAAELGSAAAEAHTTPPHLGEQARAIAATLRNASVPLIISGTGCGHAGIVDAAAAIAAALTNPDRPASLSYCLTECNTLGSSLVAGDDGMALEDVLAHAERDGIDNLLVLENDLFRRAAASEIDHLYKASANIVVMDTLETPSCNNADWVLPTASFAECEGTLVSQEGRAQRHFPVFCPTEPCRENWRWLLGIGQCADRPGFRTMSHFDDITTSCATAIPALQGIAAAAPTLADRTGEEQVPRLTHRSSGRTAMRANVSVHEPRQPSDKETPLSFTMEGRPAEQPGALLPYVWSPGWNSNQSLHKFQAQVGGALLGGTAGKRLLEPGSGSVSDSIAHQPAQLSDGEFRLVALHRIFGSDELSARSPAVAELSGRASLDMPATIATALGVDSGDGVTVTLDDVSCDLEVRLNDSLATNCVGYSYGVEGTGGLVAGAAVRIARANQWRRTPELIGSDRGEVSA